MVTAPEADAYVEQFTIPDGMEEIYLLLNTHHELSILEDEESKMVAIFDSEYEEADWETFFFETARAKEMEYLQ